jgi:phenylpropionate dioxygenase-like ring-hydroxylating dioxygenase large terminal subunit
MERDQLIDLTRRAVKLARDKATDLAPAEHTVLAHEYTSVERHERDVAMLMASPQLVGYVSELPEPGTYCTKSVMGRSVLLTRTSTGAVKAFNNVCLHRQSQVVTGCGKAKSFTCPYHAWTYDNSGKLVGLPGREGFRGVQVKSDGLTELPATEFAGFLWVAFDPTATLDIAAHLGPLAEELDSWGIGRGLRWARKFSTRRSTGNWRSTPFQRITTSPRSTAKPSPELPAATARCSIRSGRITG